MLVPTLRNLIFQSVRELCEVFKQIVHHLSCTLSMTLVLYDITEAAPHTKIQTSTNVKSNGKNS